MSENGADERPRIILEFAGPGMADLTIRIDRASPAQLYTAAWFLGELAHETRQGQLMQQAVTGLTVPRPGAPVDLTRIKPSHPAGGKHP